MLTSKRATVAYADKRDAGRLIAVLTLMSELANEAPASAEQVGMKPAKTEDAPDKPAQAKTEDPLPGQA